MHISLPDKDLAYLPEETQEFHDYQRDLQWGQKFALLNREEMVRAEDLGSYYRIASDNRDLNYALFFEKGERKVAEVEDYTSANTHHLTDEELKAILVWMFSTMM